MKIAIIVLSIIMQTWPGQYAKAADDVQLANSFSKATDVFAEYNGLSAEAPADDPLSEADYNQKNLDLTAFIWADSEISSKLCKPVGGVPPVTYKNWWTAVEKYVAAEKTRNTISLKKQQEIKAKITELNNTNEYDVQTGALQMQIEVLNIIIDSMSGSSLSQGEKSSESISRIGSREELLAAVLKAQEDTIAEDKKLMAAYGQCLSGIDTSRSISNNACTKSTKDCARTKRVCNEDSSSCEDVPDPVPGSCELKTASCMMITTNLPLFERVPVEDLKALYTMAPVPSKEMNERLIRIINIMDQEINIFFPTSPDSSYDWLTPLEECTIPVKKLITDYGVMCPSDAKDGKDYVQSTFDHLGRSDDFFKESARIMVGEINPSGTPTYLDSKAFYNTQLKAVTEDPANKGKSAKELENIALNKFWAIYVTTSPYSQNFIANRPTNHGIDEKAAIAYAEHVMKINNETEWTCNDDICRTPLLPVQAPKIVIPEYARVTESAKKFLDAVGIKDSLGDEMGVYLSDKWNNSDLVIGQTHHRQHYFKYIAELIKPLIASDSSKLATLLLRRQALIENYEKLMKGLGKGTRINSSTVVAKNNGNTQTLGTDTLDSNARNLQNAGAESAIPSLNKLALSQGAGANSAGALSVASNGLISYLKGGAISGNNLNGAASAVKYSKNANDKIQKSNQKIAALNKGKSKDQLASDQKSFDSFSKKMAAKVSPKSAMAAGSLFASGASSGASTNSSSSGDGSSANKAGSSTAASSSGGYASSSGSGYSGAGGFRGSSAGSFRGGSSDSSSDKASAVDQRALARNDDQQRINDAIRAQQERDRALTEPDENDSIFTKLTKAYFRNYEKLK